jgi:hypothetical protein
MTCGSSAGSKQIAQDGSSVSSKFAEYSIPLLSRDWSSSTQLEISAITYQAKIPIAVQEYQTHCGRVLHPEYHQDGLVLQYLSLLLVGSPN